MDKGYCISICATGLIFWWVFIFLAAVWNYAAHKRSKEFEEYHGYRYSTDNGHSVEEETEALRELGL